MGLKTVVHLGNILSLWSFFWIPLWREGEEPEEDAERSILILHGEAKAVWIAGAMKNEAHLLRGDAESSDLILVHFIPGSTFSGATSCTITDSSLLVPWEGNTQTLGDKNHSQAEPLKPRGATVLSQDPTEAEQMGRHAGP